MTAQDASNEVRQDMDAQGDRWVGVDLTPPSDEFQAELVKRLPVEYRELANAIFTAGRETLIDWTIQRARERRARAGWTPQRRRK